MALMQRQINTIQQVAYLVICEVNQCTCHIVRISLSQRVAPPCLLYHFRFACSHEAVFSSSAFLYGFAF